MNVCIEMSKVLCFLITLAVISVDGQNTAGSPKLVGAKEYFVDIMQDLVSEIEDFGWWNLKLLDVTQDIDEHMYSWHVKGKVKYTNGFVVTIEKIDLIDIKDTMRSRTVNNTVEWNASVQGIINLGEIKVGFDVIVNLDDGTEQRYTGTYTYSDIQIQCTILKNMNTNAYTVYSETEKVVAGREVKMIYLPVTHVTQVLSRIYVPSSNWNSVTAWCTNIIDPMLIDLVQKMDYPSACFSC